MEVEFILLTYIAKCYLKKMYVCDEEKWGVTGRPSPLPYR